MLTKILCSHCKEGFFEPSTKSRRRVIYVCTKCGKEFAVKKFPKNHKELEADEQTRAD